MTKTAYSVSFRDKYQRFLHFPLDIILTEASKIKIIDKIHFVYQVFILYLHFEKSKKCTYTGLANHPSKLKLAVLDVQ